MCFGNNMTIHIKGGKVLDPKEIRYYYIIAFKFCHKGLNKCVYDTKYPIYLGSDQSLRQKHPQTAQTNIRLLHRR